jgi:mRNA-degrading endonuclease toxin of MazEF toxin-antitoxin module
VVDLSQGEVWWANLPEPTGSGPGFRRPVVIVQGNALNRSRIATVVCVPLTSNLTWARAPGNVLLSAKTAYALDGLHPIYYPKNVELIWFSCKAWKQTEQRD